MSYPTRPLHLAALGAAAALSISTAAEGARASEVAPDVVRPADVPYRFDGRGIYAGGGAGMLTDLGTATENWSILATFPLSGRMPDGSLPTHGVARWFAVEATGFGFHFASSKPDAMTSGSVALGIGVGMRFAAPATSRVRPYMSARFEHIHMLYDPMVPGATDSTSAHRWGVAGLLGLELRLTERLRGGFEAGPTLFSGSGTHGGGQAVALFGVGF